jgi:hypothetical protein
MYIISKLVVSDKVGAGKRVRRAAAFSTNPFHTIRFRTKTLAPAGHRTYTAWLPPFLEHTHSCMVLKKPDPANRLIQMIADLGISY